MTATTLVITNDFPPRIGGIESFVAEVCDVLDSDVVVYTSAAPGADRYDATRPYPVVRDPGPLLPGPRAARRAAALVRATGARRVLFGAAAPLALLTPGLRRAGASRVVALTHGHEVWWAGVPGARSALRRIGDNVDHLTTISQFTADRIAPVLSASARSRLRRLPPPVDVTTFTPGPGRPSARTRGPRAVAVGRLVAQKGFGTLLVAWRRVIDLWPAGMIPPELVVVGDGPQRVRLTRLAHTLQLGDTLTWTGALPRLEVVGWLQRCDVFALPVRTRLGGLNPEGLGLAALEAAACGLPVVVGDSGGAPETVRHGQTGYVVSPDRSGALADRITYLLRNPNVARQMGSQGRDFVVHTWGRDAASTTLRSILGLDPSPIPLYSRSGPRTPSEPVAG